MSVAGAGSFSDIATISPWVHLRGSLYVFVRVTVLMTIDPFAGMSASPLRQLWPVG
jgi:hypothetical protein